MLAGSWLLDLDGNWAGFMASERSEDEALSKFSASAPTSTMPVSLPGAPRLRPFMFADLKPHFANPRGHFDPEMVPVTEQEEKRLVWLGVEYSRLTKELAQSLKCEKATRSGLVGLMVTTIYPSSPAAKVGVRENDILLRLLPEGKDQPVELRGSRFQPPTIRPSSRFITRPFWRSRKTRFTQMLTVLGPGTKAKLRLFREGRERDVDVTLEKAPPDFGSADEYKDEALGLTAKDLTYEVRHALSLGAAEPGVIIAKVESGSPASQAKLQRYELIVSVDGGQLRNVDDLKKTIEAARNAGRTQARLLINRLGESRFADLNLPAK